MKRIVWSLVIAVLALARPASAEESLQLEPVKVAAIGEIKEVYLAVDTDAVKCLPIGVFDSGTGGLTVLEKILTLDAFENISHKPSAGGDGKPDFANESFIFLADQANMPYGNYPVVGKVGFLEDLIVKDAWFLMGRRKFRVTNNGEKGDHFIEQSKSPVKAIVIACNTATAYGQDDIEQVINAAGLDIKVIGVIAAGAKGAVESLDGEAGTIGVVATKGTVLSNAYPKAIREIAKATGQTQRIDVFQQGALGLAGSIDGAPAYILPGAASAAARNDYYGPSMTSTEAKIGRGILGRYDFDFAENRMLYSGARDNPTDLQLNSVENYIAYHLVSLMEQIRSAGDALPLRAIVLGCTHFPFYKDAFRQELDRLGSYREDNRFVYRAHMADRIELIDPAHFTARELYESLCADGRIRLQCNIGRPRGEFCVTIPCRRIPNVKLNPSGGFAYDYKYGRLPGAVDSDFRAVAFDETAVRQDALNRLQRQVPTVWRLICDSRGDVAGDTERVKGFETPAVRN
jgi:glutamate racemase